MSRCDVADVRSLTLGAEDLSASDGTGDVICCEVIAPPTERNQSIFHSFVRLFVHSFIPFIYSESVHKDPGMLMRPVHDEAEAR